jgi:hypothetical protein
MMVQVRPKVIGLPRYISFKTEIDDSHGREDVVSVRHDVVKGFTPYGSTCDAGDMTGVGKERSPTPEMLLNCIALSGIKWVRHDQDAALRHAFAGRKIYTPPGKSFPSEQLFPRPRTARDAGKDVHTRRSFR